MCRCCAWLNVCVCTCCQEWMWCWQVSNVGLGWRDFCLLPFSGVALEKDTVRCGVTSPLRLPFQQKRENRSEAECLYRVYAVDASEHLDSLPALPRLLLSKRPLSAAVKETLPLNKRIAQSYVLKLQMKDGVGDGGEERLVLFFASLLTRTQRKPLLLTICWILWCQKTDRSISLAVQ